jgi:hypothetical protein
MKAIIFILSVLFITNNNAQKKFDCASKISEYHAFFKANKIAESYTVWSDVSKNCPKENEGIYTDGIQILQHKIDTAALAEEKVKLVHDVLKLYDQYNKNYPPSTPDYEVGKAMYYLAIQTARKAGIVETRLKPAADKIEKKLESKSVTAAEISKAKMNGKSVSIGSWINETITFPAKS